MLGESMVLGCIAVPVCCASFWIASRRRLSLQWRDELLDLDAKVYQKASDGELRATFRKVQPVDTVGTGHEISPLERHEDIGLYPQPLFSSDECDMLLNELKSWSEQYGQERDQRFTKHQEMLCQHAIENAPSYIDSLPTESAKRAAWSLLEDVRNKIPLLSRTKIVADHAIDCHLMKAPWGSGDRLKAEKMPAALRHCVSKVQQAFPGIGRLRHVYMEYAPDGALMHPPSCPKAFDGHDYVIIPLERGHANDDALKPSTIITMTPLLRSRQTIPTETLFSSWSSRDIDARIAKGSVMRVFGPARYFWSWSIRPSAWFGCCADAARPKTSTADPGSWGNKSVSSLWTTVKQCLTRRSKESTSAPDIVENDRGVMVLHFEGPRSVGKSRSLLLHPESLVFGFAPKPQTFERWVEERPSEDEVWSDFIVVWMIRHYFDMLTIT